MSTPLQSRTMGGDRRRAIRRGSALASNARATVLKGKVHETRKHVQHLGKDLPAPAVPSGPHDTSQRRGVCDPLRAPRLPGDSNSPDAAGRGPPLNPDPLRSADGHIGHSQMEVREGAGCRPFAEPLEVSHSTLDLAQGRLGAAHVARQDGREEGDPEPSKLLVRRTPAPELDRPGVPPGLLRHGAGRPPGGASLVLPREPALLARPRDSPPPCLSSFSFSRAAVRAP